MMVSKTAQYGLRAVTYLAKHGGDGAGWIRIDDVAAALDVPRNYLSKVMHALARAGLLESARGPGGGFRLARNPREVMLGEVLGVLDEWEDGRSPCLLRDGPCDMDAPCVAHHRWREIAAEVRAFFGETSIEALLRGATHPAVRL